MKTETEIVPETKNLGLPSFKRVIKLPAAIGDWTTLRAPQIQAKKIKRGLSGFNRLSEEELINSHNIHYHFFENFSKRLSRILNINVQLYSVEAVQVSYSEFSQQTHQPIVQFTLATKEIGNISFLVDLALADSIINRSLAESDSHGMLRGLTEAEEEVLLVSIKEVLSELPFAFSNILEISDLTIIGSPSISLDPTLNPNDTFVVFSGEISIKGNPPSKITIGYLYSTLKILLSRTSQSPEPELDLKKLPHSITDKIILEAKAGLGSSVITTCELNDLEVGDVVLLDSSLVTPASLIISESIELAGKIGIKNEHLALKIFREKDQKEKIEIRPPKFTLLPAASETETELEQPQVAAEINPGDQFSTEEFDEEFKEDEFGEEFPEDEFEKDEFSEDEFEENLEDEEENTP